METNTKVKRFCSQHSPEEALTTCRHDPESDHEFIPTSTYYRCAYGKCYGYKCQICDKFEVIG